MLDDLVGVDVAPGDSKLMDSSQLVDDVSDSMVYWFCVDAVLLLKIVLLKLGRPHWKQHQLTFANPKYTASLIPIQCWRYHTSQLSQHIPGVVHFTALVHVPQGYRT
jgi:hypothetical protein